jgi:hypothetical protein
MNDFVFRSADRMRIDGCTNAIAREGLSLALQCEYEALIDHYLGLLLARLRQQAPEHSIEVYFPTNADALLVRFNEALARQSLAQATQTPEITSKAQIWVVHDAQALPDTEIQLLARLIQNFPGANIRAILLMTGASGTHHSLASFGRKILRWEIEAPNSEQSQAALELARAEGRIAPVQQLLRRIQARAWTETATVDFKTPDDAPPFSQIPHTGLPIKSSRSEAHSRLDNFYQHGLNAIQTWRHAIGQLGSKHLRMALIVAAIFATAALVMLWIQPEAFGIGQPKATSNVKVPLTTPAQPVPTSNLVVPGNAAESPASPPLASPTPTVNR